MGGGGGGGEREKKKKEKTSNTEVLYVHNKITVLNEEIVLSFFLQLSFLKYIPWHKINFRITFISSVYN